jgi:hypothetical protein
MHAAINNHALAVEALLAGSADVGQVDTVRKREWGQHDGWCVVGEGVVGSGWWFRSWFF